MATSRKTKKHALEHSSCNPIIEALGRVRYENGREGKPGKQYFSTFKKHLFALETLSLLLEVKNLQMAFNEGMNSLLGSPLSCLSEDLL